MSRIYKVLIVSILIWSVISTSLFSYYYLQYINLAAENDILRDRLKRYRDVLIAFNNTLVELNKSYTTLFEKYKRIINRLKLILNQSVAILVIDYGGGRREFYKVSFVDGVNDTAFDLLKAVANIKYTFYKEYNDVFIECINGVCNHPVNETSGYYWMLYINFELSPYGAMNTKVSDGDIVIWNYTLVSW